MNIQLGLNFIFHSSWRFLNICSVRRLHNSYLWVCSVSLAISVLVVHMSAIWYAESRIYLGTFVCLITLCFTYLHNRPNRPCRSVNECSSADVGSPARWLRYIELNQLGARIMKMHASPAAGRQLCWLAGWPAGRCKPTCRRRGIAISKHTCIHLCVCVYQIHMYIYNLIFTLCRSYVL